MFDYDLYGNAFVDMRLHKLRVLITEQCDDLFLDQGIVAPSLCISVLLYLLQNKHGSIAQIAEALGYSHQLINHRLVQLEKNGFTHRFSDVRDRRKWLIKLTSAGREEARRVEAAMPMISGAFDELLESVGLDLTQKLRELQQELTKKPIRDRANPDRMERSA